MQHKQLITIASIVTFTIFEAFALHVGVLRLLVASNLPFVSNELATTIVTLMISLLIGLMIGWLVFKKWSANLWVKISVAAIIVIGSFLLAHWIAVLLLRQKLWTDGYTSK